MGLAVAGPLKDVPPPHVMAPMAIAKSDGLMTPSAIPGPPAAGGPAPGGPGGVPPRVKPVGADPALRPVPVAPAGPAPAPGVLGLAVNGVTEADLDASDKAKLNMLRSGNNGRNASAAEQTDALRRNTDRAAQFAKERAFAYKDAIDAYRQAAGKQAVAVPPLAEKYVAQQTRTPVPPLVVREYAAPRPAAVPLADAAEAPDTVLWQPVIVLPADGKATLTFHLGAAPGGYQVVIAGHTADGRLGAVRGLIPVARPQTVAPVAPAGPLPPGAPVAPAPRPMP